MDGNVKFGAFLNEYVTNPQVFIPLVVFASMFLPVFGVFYNRLMDKLDKNSEEYKSLWVAIGNLITISVTALFSWKAALLVLALFILDGSPMIIGDFKREDQRKSAPRVKRFPYKVNAFLDDIKMAGSEARNILGKAIKTERDLSPKEMTALEHEINEVLLKVMEINVIQGKSNQ